MELKQIKCPNCGGELKLNRNEEHGECKYCHCKFVNKNDATTTNRHLNPKDNDNKQKDILKDEGKQNEVLLMMLKDFDFSNLKRKALDILSINPNNQLAKMLYKLDFHVDDLLYGDITTFSFATAPVTDYFEKNKGKVDSEVSIHFLTLLGNINDFSKEDFPCTKAILNNLEMLPNDKTTFSFYKDLLTVAKQETADIKKVKNILRKTPKGLTTFLLTDNEYLGADVAEYRKDAKKVKSILEKSHNNFIKSILDCAKESSNLSDAEKKELNSYVNQEKWLAIAIGVIVCVAIFIFSIL